MGKKKGETSMTEYTVVNILDLMDYIGEDEVKSAIAEFRCDKNQEIERYMHDSAIEFSKRKISITHLILNSEGEIVAYFTIAHKPSRVPLDCLSNTAKKKLSRYGRLDDELGVYDISAFLIAQFGKNQAVESDISGNEMMRRVIDLLVEVQHKVGGGVLFLECEDQRELLDFYKNDQNRFIEYGERESKSDQTLYKQLLRFF